MSLIGLLTAREKKVHPQIGLFATRFINMLPVFVSLVPGSLYLSVDVLSQPWEDLDPYAFPPAVILGKVVEKLQDYPCKKNLLITPGMTKYALVLGSRGHVQPNRTVIGHSQSVKLLTQSFNQISHRNLTNLNLHALLLEPQLLKIRAALKQFQPENESNQRGST